MSLALLEQIVAARVEDAADAAARVLGLTPTPMDISQPVKAAMPDHLSALADGWKRARGELDDNAGELGRGAERAFDGWRGRDADAAFDYVSGVAAAMTAQAAAMGELHDALQDLSEKLAEAQRAVRDAEAQAGVALMAAGVWAVAILIALAATPGAQVAIPEFISVAVELVLALLLALYAILYGRNRAADDAERSATEALTRLLGLQGADRLEHIETPSVPEFTDVTVRYDHCGFYSEHVPDDLRNEAR